MAWVLCNSRKLEWRVIYGEETRSKSQVRFLGMPSRPPEEVRLRNVPASRLKTAICLGGKGPSVSAQGFTRPKTFTYGHQVKGKGKNPAAL